MKLLFAFDSFKGTLSSRDTAGLLERAARKVLGDVECHCVQMADGGEGTVDAVIGSTNGIRMVCKTHDALMREIHAEYGIINNKVAVIEMAAAAGLTLVAKPQRNPLLASSFGVGELIKDALDKGFREIFVTLGGSATNDGGMGCLRALGVKFYDAFGVGLEGKGEDLEHVKKIDLTNLDPRLQHAEIKVLTDVRNTLCGSEGATMIFGRQKGADEEMLGRLEKGMQNYRHVLEKNFGKDPDSLVGGGAAGGLGAALQLVLNARQQAGIEAVLQLVGFEQLLDGVDLVVTGEGKADFQSCQGKVVQGVGSCCASHGVPVVALVGSKGEGADELLRYGIGKIVAIADERVSEEEAMSHPRECYLQRAEEMFEMLKNGVLL